MSTCHQVVVMGASGCGKSSIGRALADALGTAFVEGDELHAPHNVRRMAAGVPLTDADRADWLAAIAARLHEAAQAQRGLVVTCSALKRSYRDRLRAAAPALRLIFLYGEPALLAERLAARRDHYMPATLLASQLATLEPPDADERPIAIHIGAPAAQITAAALAALKAAA